MSDKNEIFEAARRLKALMENVHRHGHNVVNDLEVKTAWATDIPLVVHGLLSFAPAVPDAKPKTEKDYAAIDRSVSDAVKTTK